MRHTTPSLRRRVPLARRNLFQDRRRALLGVVGIGAALLLVVVLEAIFAGAMHQVTAYIRNSPADVFVAQEGVRTMHMTQSALPVERLEAARAINGVAWAAALRYTTSVVDTGEGQRLTYVFGYDVATGRGGPPHIAEGEPPRAGQVVVDDVAADELGIGVGDRVLVLGEPFIVSGLSTDGTNIVNTTVFIPDDDFIRLRGDSIAYLLIGADPGAAPDELVGRLDAALPGVTAQTRAEFAHEEASVVRDMAADVMRIMTVIGFLISLAVVGLTLFTTTLSKLRDYGVVKALGAGSGRLVASVLTQAAWSIALGLLVAVSAGFAVAAALDEFTPNVTPIMEPGAVARTAAGALVVGAIGALLPLRRVLRVDPATAFRRPT